LTDAKGKARSREPRLTGGEARARRCAVAGVLLWVGACTNTTLDLWERDPPLLDPGLLAHWALDESQLGSAGAVVDSSGFGNHGTASTNPPVPVRDVPPVHFRDGGSMSFNGQDQWIQMGNPPVLNIGGPISMAAWARPTRIDDAHNIVGHGYRWNPDHDFALRISKNNYMFTRWDGSDHAAVFPVPATDVGAWVHLCGVFDGSTYRLYHNGTLAAFIADTILPPANIDAIWGLGGRAPQDGNSNVDYLWQGQLDDVRIYGRALAADEVMALYQR
jgi:hypothetical protein